MTAALNLYKRKTQVELLAMQEAIHANPACRNLAGGIHLYTPKARTKLANIAWAISYHMDDTRKAAMPRSV